MPLTNADIVYYPSLTGSSEGGAKSGTPLVSGVDNNLWSNLSSIDLLAGGVRHRKIYIANDSASDDWVDPVTWISLPATNMTEVLAIGVDSADDDDPTVGGTMVQFVTPAVLEAVSDGGDTRTLTIRGIDDSDVPTTEDIVLTGTTPVDSVALWSVIYGVFASATSGSRTVLLKEGVAGTTRGTLIPGSLSQFVWISASSKVAGIQYVTVGAGEAIPVWWRQTWDEGVSGVRPNDDRITAEEA